MDARRILLAAALRRRYRLLPLQSLVALDVGLRDLLRARQLLHAWSEAAIDLWAKDLAPSTDLRKWFGHDPERWTEFKRRYTAELRQQTELLEDLRRLARRGPVTLIYAARDQ